MIFILYLLTGIVAGILAGLLGVGGGLVVVPALAVLFTWTGMSPKVVMHLAVGTSLASIVFTASSSTWAHHRHGAVDWDLVVRMGPGIVAGVIAGALVADRLSGPALARVFGVFLLLVAWRMGVGRLPSPHRRPPASLALAGAGGIIGGISALVGIGGGTMSVPFLVWCNLPMRGAVATSAALGLPIAVTGALMFGVTGSGRSELPDWASGYVHWQALAGIVLTSVPFAPLGARLAHRLPTRTLRRVFALFLIVVAGGMLLAAR